MEAYYECIEVLVRGYFLAPPEFISLMRKSFHGTFSTRDSFNKRLATTAPCPDAQLVREMFAVAEGCLEKAEKYISVVVEIEARLAEALQKEVLLVTGDRAQIHPKVLSPSLMFRDELSQPAPEGPQFSEFTEKEKLFPQIPASRLALDFCGVQYNSLLVLKRTGVLRSENAKNKANALYLGDIRSLLDDLEKLRRQREGLEHVLFQAQQRIPNVLAVAPRVLAEQLSLLDSLNFAHLQPASELEFSGWLGKERRLRAPNLTAMREFAGFISHVVTWECLQPGLTLQQRAECIIHFVAVGECLEEMASYHMLMAVMRGLSMHSLLRLGPLISILPKKTIISWDNLQSMVLDGNRQRALLSKAPGSCIPALDTAYLAELLYFEPQLLTLKRVSEADDQNKAHHKFVKYCEALEKFRLQSVRFYGLKLSCHPAIQHFLLTRPFLSETELMAASQSILSSGAAEVLTPQNYPVKVFYRRYLDDPDRLFLPLQYSARQEEDLPVLQDEPEDTIPVDDLSLGEQPTLVDHEIIMMDDAEERVARWQGTKASVIPPISNFSYPIDV